MKTRKTKKRKSLILYLPGVGFSKEMRLEKTAEVIIIKNIILTISICFKASNKPKCKTFN